MIIATGFAVVLGLAITTFETYIFISYTNQTSTYDQAPVCGSARATRNCKLESSAEIVSKHIENGDPTVDLSVAELGGKTYTAVLLSNDRPFWDTLQTGSSVSAELWNGYVSRLAGRDTRASPDALPNAGLWPTAIFGFFTLFSIALLIVLLGMNRRAWRR